MPEWSLGDIYDGGIQIRVSEIKHLTQVVRHWVPAGEGSQSPKALDKLQHRRMIVKSFRNIPSPRKRRNDQARLAKAAQPESVRFGFGLELRRRNAISGFRADMVEKSAPFIEVDNQDCVGPVRAGDDGIVDASQEGFAIPDV